MARRCDLNFYFMVWRLQFSACTLAKSVQVEHLYERLCYELTLTIYIHRNCLSKTKKEVGGQFKGKWPKLCNTDLRNHNLFSSFLDFVVLEVSMQLFKLFPYLTGRLEESEPWVCCFTDWKAARNKQKTRKLNFMATKTLNKRLKLNIASSSGELCLIADNFKARFRGTTE